MVKVESGAAMVAEPAHLFTLQGRRVISELELIDVLRSLIQIS